MTDALRALEPIAAQLNALSFELLDASAGDFFVLGDTPLAQSDLLRGFTVPLSKGMAVRAFPASPRVSIRRRTATSAEVEACNKTQWEMALDIAVGPDATVLQRLGPK